MNHHTVTATFATRKDEVFAYLANIENLPEKVPQQSVDRVRLDRARQTLGHR